MSSNTDIQGVIETVDMAISYRSQLSHLLDCLHEAKNQVETSAAQSRTKLRSHFDCLRQCVDEALNERFAALERAVSDAEHTALEPLEKCEQLLNERVEVAANILSDGKILLETEDQGEHGPNREAMLDFKSKSKDLDLNSLPEVPSLWDTACIQVDLPRDEENVQKQLVDAVRDYGRVLTSAPVQIVDISERPAALLVTWAETAQSDDHSLGLDVFRLQSCVGAVRGVDLADEKFTDVYEGPNTSYIVRRLQQGVQYSFRVCGRCDCTSSWTPWSLPVTWATNLPRHEWRPKVPGYKLTDDSVTVQRDTSYDGVTADLVYSLVPSYTCGHSITFHVAGVSDALPAVDEGVGLAVTDESDSSDVLHRKHFLFYSFQGGVFVDGSEKTTRLPAVTSDCAITFETEVIQPNKVRVTVEVNEKIITFDWLLPERQATDFDFTSALGSGCIGGPEKIHLFFAARFSSQDLSLTVE